MADLGSIARLVIELIKNDKASAELQKAEEQARKLDSTQQKLTQSTKQLSAAEDELAKKMEIAATAGVKTEGGMRAMEASALRMGRTLQQQADVMAATNKRIDEKRIAEAAAAD